MNQPAANKVATTRDPAYRRALEVEAKLAEQGRAAAPATPVQKTDEQWRVQLGDRYVVLRQKGTERAFTGKYYNTKDSGVYRCAGCGEVLFESDEKFDSGCGWPSFNAPAAAGKIKYIEDNTHGMHRTEVVCARCGGHLGHVFDDGFDQPTGLRYCINSASIDLDTAVKPGEAPAGPPAAGGTGGDSGGKP